MKRFRELKLAKEGAAAPKKMDHIKKDKKEKSKSRGTSFDSTKTGAS